MRGVERMFGTPAIGAGERGRDLSSRSRPSVPSDGTVKTLYTFSFRRAPPPCRSSARGRWDRPSTASSMTVPDGSVRVRPLLILNHNSINHHLPTPALHTSHVAAPSGAGERTCLYGQHAIHDCHRSEVHWLSSWSKEWEDVANLLYRGQYSTGEHVQERCSTAVTVDSCSLSDNHQY